MAEQQASSGGERDPRAARGCAAQRAPHAPAPNLAWRATLRSRILIGGGRSSCCGRPASRPAWSTCRSSSTPTCRRAPIGSTCGPSPRRPSAARSSTATARCSPTASTPTASSPIRRRSSTRTRSRSSCAARSTTADARERQEMAQDLRRDSQFVYLARKLSPDEAQRVKALELKGVGFIKESRRYYPKKELAAHVLGYVGLDNTGLAGLESTYDPQVRGREGKVLVQTDARRHALNSRVDRPATAGCGARADHRSVPPAHRRARAARRRRREPRGRRQRRDHGSEHRRDPRARQLADLQPEHVRPRRRSRAAQPRDPGSLRAGLDVQDRDRVGGARGRGHRARRSGRLRARATSRLAAASRSTTSIATACCSFTDVIVKSSNVGAIKVGLRLGPERLGRYVTPLRVRPDAEPGLPRREPGHRLESGAGSTTARWRRCRWATRSA